MLCLHVRVHLQSAMRPLLHNISCFVATPSISYHLPSLPCQVFSTALPSHRASQVSRHRWRRTECEGRGLLWLGKWQSVHLLCLNRPVISLKGIIFTAARDRGPNLACEQHFFRSPVNIIRRCDKLEGPVFSFVCFLWLWDDRYCDTGGKWDFKDKTFPSASLHQWLIYLIGFWVNSIVKK